MPNSTSVKQHLFGRAIMPMLPSADVKLHGMGKARITPAERRAAIERGNRVRAVMAERHLGCNAVDRLAKLPGGYTSEIRNGGKPRAASGSLHSLADALSVNLEWLLTGNGPKEKQASTQISLGEIGAMFSVPARRLVRWANSTDAIADCISQHEDMTVHDVLLLMDSQAAQDYKKSDELYAYALRLRSGAEPRGAGSVTGIMRKSDDADPVRRKLTAQAKKE